VVENKGSRVDAPNQCWEDTLQAALDNPLSRRRSSTRSKYDLQTCRLRQIVKAHKFPPQGIRQLFPNTGHDMAHLPIQDMRVPLIRLEHLAPSVAYTLAQLACHHQNVQHHNTYASLTGHDLQTLLNKATPIMSLNHLLMCDIIEEVILTDTRRYGLSIVHLVPEKLMTPKARLRQVTDTLSANVQLANFTEGHSRVVFQKRASRSR
jgi:hypothetical protein